MKKNIISNPGLLVIVFIIALGVAKYIKPGITFALITVLILSSTILMFAKNRIALVFLAAALGIFYFELTGFMLTPRALPNGCEEIIISSAVKISGGKLEFLAKNSEGLRFITTIKSSDHFGYADKVKLCSLTQQSDPAASFKNYLKGRYKTDYLFKAQKIELVASGRGPIRMLLNLADFFSQKTQTLYGGDTGVLAKGLVIGGSSDFSDNLKNALKSSGTSHLVAVSGYNVSIFAVIMFNAVRNLFSRRIAVVLSLITVIGFCILSGATASVIRASIMAGAYIIGKIIGRRGAALNSLLFAAFVMVLLNPYILWDIGFELSAAAMAGIILAEPLIKLSSVAFWQILFETLSAQIATLPILLVNFGRISLVAPVTNILILPFVPLAMGLVAISIGFSTIFTPLGIIIGGVSAVLLDYFLFVIKSFGALSFASISTDKSQLGWLLYLPIAAIFYLIKFKLRNKRLL